MTIEILIAVDVQKDSSEPTLPEEPGRPTHMRRLLAMIYEILPLFSLAFFATAPLVAVMPGDHVPAGSWWYRAYLLAVLGLYLAWSWTRGGQSLGMRPWRLVVVSTNDRPLGWARAWMRFGVALAGWVPLGAGHWWMLVDRQGRTWHDLASKTRVIQRPR